MSTERSFGELVLNDVVTDVAISGEYRNMIQHINDNLPSIRRDSQNFYKSSSQFKNVTLDVTDITPMSSLKHILAVIDKTRMALEEAHIKTKRKQIELKQKTQDFDNEIDSLKKDLLWIDILEIHAGLNNSENAIKGAIRKLSFFTTQYQAILKKMNVVSISEHDFELNESRHHVMTAMKQALIAARTRGGIIDEGNHIYLFDMGINGAVAQAEIFAYLRMEEELIKQGKEPTHAMTVRWLEACADKFADCGRLYAESRGFEVLDQKSLAKDKIDG